MASVELYLLVLRHTLISGKILFAQITISTLKLILLTFNGKDLLSGMVAKNGCTVNQPVKIGELTMYMT